MLSRVLLLLTAACLAAATLVVAGDALPRQATAHASTGLAAHNDTSTPFNLVHLPRLARGRYDGGRLALRDAQRDGRVVHHRVRYRGAGLKLTGTLTRPARTGRFPLVVLAHGYHAPASYRPVRVSLRERVFLARRGFVVLQPDYRNHGGSDREGDHFVARPSGYPEDLLNAVRAVWRADLPFLRPGRANLFGRSMGGGVALQAAVARPSWFRTAVLSSPISSRAADSFRRWVEPGTELRRRVVDAYGLPRDNPSFWNRASVRRYLQHLEVPVVVHHGTGDTMCPPAWSRGTVRAVRSSGGRARLHAYNEAGHTFRGSDWRLMMRRTVAGYR